MSSSYSWKASADLEILKKRADFLSKIRQFFAKNNILEVETPLLASSTNPDPYIESFQVPYNKKTYYLQTSPEFHMKRLLASGSGPIYQITKAFRKGEISKQHNPEFTMLEWYQPYMHYHKFMDELEVFLNQFFKLKTTKITYQKLFETTLGINPFLADIANLKKLAKKHKLVIENEEKMTKMQWLDLFLAEIIEPQLKKEDILFVYDFPKEQACLATLKKTEPFVAERFEVYIKGVEVANGFHELVDGKEQHNRFLQDCHDRKSQGTHIPAIDNNFIESLKFMPEATGVAIGIDRLMMLLFDKSYITEVQAFPFDRA